MCVVDMDLGVFVYAAFAASQFLDCEISCIHFWGRLGIQRFRTENEWFILTRAEELWY